MIPSRVFLKRKEFVEMNNGCSAVGQRGWGGRIVGVVVSGNTEDPCGGENVLDPCFPVVVGIQT